MSKKEFIMFFKVDYSMRFENVDEVLGTFEVEATSEDEAAQIIADREREDFSFGVEKKLEQICEEHGWNIYEIYDEIEFEASTVA